MGYALAAAALERGHQVHLVSGPVAIDPPDGADVVSVVSAREMFEACCRLFDDCDAGILTAAVCDYEPSRTLTHKLKKQARIRRVTLKPTRDICAHLGSVKGDRVVIGFAMEDHHHRANAEAKLARKRCDAIVLNGPENVGGNRASVEILTAHGTWSPAVRGSKDKVAKHVVRLTERLVQSRLLDAE